MNRNNICKRKCHIFYLLAFEYNADKLLFQFICISQINNLDKDLNFSYIYRKQ